MLEPLRRLKFLPWRSLLQAAVITMFIVAALDYLLVLGSMQNDAIGRVVSFVYAPPMNILLTIAAAVGIGVLAVYLLERFYQQVIINTPSLWALVLCLIVVLFLKSVSPLPSLLVGFSEIEAVCIILGVFWKGRPYWQYRQ